MKTVTFRRLETLRQEYRPGRFGKITQKLLALAFYDAGFHHFVERGSQGVDIDVANPAGNKYALEVKTTDGETVAISKENIDALEARATDGYLPLIAALRMQLFEDWVLAAIPLNQLRPGALPFSRLRAYRLRELEGSICPAFEAVVNEHINGVLSRGEQYLIKVLAQRREGDA